MTAVPSAAPSAADPVQGPLTAGRGAAEETVAPSAPAEGGRRGRRAKKGEGTDVEAGVATEEAKPGKAPKASKPPKPPKAAKAGKEGKKSKLPKILILLVVVAGLGFMEKGKFVKPHYKPGQQAPNGQVLSLSDSTSGSSNLTTSLSDGHLVQVVIDLQLTTVASSKKVTAEVPQFLDAAVSVLSTQTYPGMLTPSGQNLAKDEILQKVQQIAGRSEGAQQVSAVYFDSLVVQ